MKKDIYWPDDGTWERLQHAAELSGLSVSEYIRRAVFPVVERDLDNAVRASIRNVIKRAPKKTA